MSERGEGMRNIIVSGLMGAALIGLAIFRSDGFRADENAPVPIQTPEIPTSKTKAKKSEPSLTRTRIEQGCGPVPASLRSPPYSLDQFYQQYCDADGIPIIASPAVDPEALRIGKARVKIMMQNLPSDVKWAMIDNQTRLAILGKNEVVTDIPEKSDLHKLFPEKRYNTSYRRGVGPTKKRPAAVTGEENVLCLKSNRLPGSDTFVHEFAHTVHRMGLMDAEPNFNSDLKKAYQDAVIKRGLWKEAYASTNYAEYWATGVQIWFDVNYTDKSLHKNYIKTKAQLVYYDPVLYNLVAKYFPAKSISICPN